MKNIISVVGGATLIIIFTVFVSNLSYFKLSRTDYQFAGHGDHMWLIKKTTGKSVTGEHVVDYWIKENYLHVLLMQNESFDCYRKSRYHDGRDVTILTHRTDVKEFWIINLEEEKETGPLEESEYLKMISKMGLSKTRLTVPSNYISNTDVINQQILECTDKSGDAINRK